MTAKPEKYVSGGNKSRSVVELGPNASKAALARSLESLRHGEGGWALGGGTRQTQGFVHALKPGEVRKVRRASDVSLTHGVSGPEVLLDPKGYVRRRRRLVLPTSPAHPELRAPQTDILGRPYGTYVPAGPVKNHRRSFVEIYRELRSEGIDHGRAMQMASERAK